MGDPTWLEDQPTRSNTYCGGDDMKDHLDARARDCNRPYPDEIAEARLLAAFKELSPEIRMLWPRGDGAGGGILHLIERAVFAK